MERLRSIRHMDVMIKSFTRSKSPSILCSPVADSIFLPIVMKRSSDMELEKPH